MPSPRRAGRTMDFCPACSKSNTQWAAVNWDKPEETNLDRKCEHCGHVYPFKAMTTDPGSDTSPAPKFSPKDAQRLKGLGIKEGATVTPPVQVQEQVQPQAQAPKVNVEVVAPNQNPQPAAPAQQQQPSAPTPTTKPRTVVPELPNGLLHMQATTKSVSRTAQAVEGKMSELNKKADTADNPANEKGGEGAMEVKTNKEKAVTANTDPKFARLRQIASEEPESADAALLELGEAFGTMAEGLQNLRDHLDLIKAPHTASLKVRIASARRYASGFRRMAEECPEVIVDAINEVWQSIDEVAAAVENFADHMGVELVESPAQEAIAEEGEAELSEAKEEGKSVDEQIHDEAEESKEEVESMGDEMKEASNNFVMNDEVEKAEDGGKKLEVPRLAGDEHDTTADLNDTVQSGGEKVTVPRVANNNAIMDNSDKTVHEEEIPQAQGKSAAAVNAIARRKASAAAAAIARRKGNQ